MKKVLVILCSVFLFLGMGTTALAEEDKDIQKALDLIENTNRQIDKDIDSAVKKADKLYNDYLAAIRTLEEGKEITQLTQEKIVILEELNQVSTESIDKEYLIVALQEIETKIEEEQYRIDKHVNKVQLVISDVLSNLVSEDDKDSELVKKKINKLHDKLVIETLQEELTRQYKEDLNKVITDVFERTLELSAKAIEKAATYGVIAECTWKLVRFGDEWVWIDPIRVVGFSDGNE